MTKILLIGLSLLSLTAAGPLTSYDQRQEGELNVKVDLDNFVIVVARPSSSSNLDLLGSMASLFADAKRATVPIHSAENEAESKPEDEEKSKNLDDVSLDNEPVVANNPHHEQAMIVLVQTTDAESKTDDSTNVGEVVRTLRNLKDVSHAGEKSKSWLSSKYKFVDSVDEPQSLKLIGDAIEGCGPGRSRDRFGICHQDRSV